MGIQTCDRCGEQFDVQVINGDQPHKPERESIDCPHCGHKTWEKTTGYFQTTKLPSGKRKS
ncbi:hypothetical protein [Pseudomonas aeruginosa]|uniref:hypothetical protein n=1 Tax=Pseudomonas aeruginosa TaxID=287 RepID=UPI003D08C9C4